MYMYVQLDNSYTCFFQTGLILVWRLEPRGQLHSTPIHHNQLSSDPMHCIVVGRLSTGKPVHSQFTSRDSIACFIAVSSGKVTDTEKSVHVPIFAMLSLSRYTVLHDWKGTVCGIRESEESI